MDFYRDKIPILSRLFGTTDIDIEPGHIVIGGSRYPVIDDVIIALTPDKYPESIRQLTEGQKTTDATFSDEVQFTFGKQWQKFDAVMDEHADEFRQYFDLIELDKLENSTVLDLGCGMGRWSYYLQPFCNFGVLVDFSDAIFAARRTMKGRDQKAVFIMADIHQLPLAADCADLAFSIGVLHHLPTNALEEVVALRRLAPRLLVYLYYALDNRPFYFRLMLWAMITLRHWLGGARSEFLRELYVSAVLYLVYMPLIGLGKLLKPFGFQHFLPLHFYIGKSLVRVRQDAYDKLLTRIEQRFTRKQIIELQKCFREVTVSDFPPFWHFVCER
jgi:SAM-dependent methyltransferase